MNRSRFLLTALALLAACERPGERAADRELAAKVLRDALVYPRSTMVSFSAGRDAAEVVLTTEASVAAVATWFRQALRLNGWDLNGDVTAGDGTISMYAIHAKQPLWITLRANSGGPGTTYTLVGADVTADSAAGQRSGSSMSSNLSHRG